MQANAISSVHVNRLHFGDCIPTMQNMSANSVDFILTDPPYLVNYQDRSGRAIKNDATSEWLPPAMQAAFRVLKPNRLMVCFYGWSKIDAFFSAWKSAGFRPVGHIVFRKDYCSKSRFLGYQHEQAYLLSKGSPELPRTPIPDVLDVEYSGNKLHPTQKPVGALGQLIRSFTTPRQLVLDPFAGSGSTCAASLLTGRRYLGIEMDDTYYAAALARLSRIQQRMAARCSAVQEQAAP